MGLQCASFLVSASCYLSSLALSGDTVTQGKSIGRIVLWYFPIAIELLAHVRASSLLGEGVFDVDALFSRCAMLVTVVFGFGELFELAIYVYLTRYTSYKALQWIINGFGFAVNDFSLRSTVAGQILCGAIIFVSMFALYFTSPKTTSGDKRSIVIVFSHLFYLASLVLTLKGNLGLFPRGELSDEMRLIYLRPRGDVTIPGEAPVNELLYSQQSLIYEPHAVHF